MTKMDLENRFPVINIGASRANIGKVVSCRLCPLFMLAEDFGGKQNPQLTARGPTHRGIKVDLCAAAN